MRTVAVAACLLLLLFAFAPLTAFAQASNGRAVISAVGKADFVASPGTTFTQPFAVKVVDANGHPLAGINVEFFVNAALCFSAGYQCDAPPPELYGHFLSDSSHVVTDANGIATAPTFVAGSLGGTYQVMAWADSIYESAGNTAIGYPAISIPLNVKQLGPTSPSIIGVPALSALALIMLAMGLVVVSWRHRLR